jgi:hypothetical protein
MGFLFPPRGEPQLGRSEFARKVRLDCGCFIPKLLGKFGRLDMNLSRITTVFWGSFDGPPGGGPTRPRAIAERFSCLLGCRGCDCPLPN